MPNIVAYSSIYVGVTDSGSIYKFDPQVPANSTQLGTVPSKRGRFAVGCHHHLDIGHVYLVMDNAGKAWRGSIDVPTTPTPIF